MPNEPANTPELRASEAACRLAQQCGGWRPHGEGWEANCPAHPDTQRSLTLTARAERVVLHCAANCAPAAIMLALGSTLASLDCGPPRGNATPRPLLPHHAEQLHASAITEAMILQRGYLTLSDYERGLDRGFAPAQAAQLPSLGMPLWNVRGEQQGWQIRPDEPRLDVHGKGIKYETPRGNRLILDVHPSVQPHLDDPAVDLWITEGVKKGDALATQGLCAIALMGGVWGWRGTNAKGGKTALTDWNSVALNGRQVFIVYDNDVMRNPRVRDALEAFANFLLSRKSTPRIILLPEDTAKIGVDDFLAQGHTLAELLACESKTLPGGAPPEPANPGRPLLTLHPHQLPTLVVAALEALSTMPNTPRVFQRVRRLCVISPAEPQSAGLLRPTSAPIISTLVASELRHLLAQAANWQTPNATGTKAFPDKPATWLVDTLLGMDAWDGIPPLTGLLGTPTLRPDGTILATSGYDTHTGLYLHFATTFPAIPDQPDIFDAANALRVLQEPFLNFPFESPHHLSAVLAAILSLLARYTVESVPLFAIRSTTPGSGKTLLADAISLIATGRLAAKLPQAREEEEEKKRLLAIALDGDPLVVIDNVKGDLGSPALDLAITGQVYKDRLLGTNQTKEAPMFTVFMATGNHMTFRGDLARRVVPIDLLPDVERPEERTGFAHADLREYVRQQRPLLVTAALTILRAYCLEGRPAQPLSTYGSFEAWSDLIRAALVWAGAVDPCLGRVGLQAASDEAYDVLGELLEAWPACYGDKPTTLKTVFHHLTMYLQEESYQRLEASCIEFAEQSGTARTTAGREQKLHAGSLGKKLAKVEKRIINGKRFERHGERDKDGTKWRVKSFLG